MKKLTDDVNSTELSNANVTISLPRMLPLKQVCFFTGLGKSTIYNMLDAKSEYYDPTFPKRVPLTKGRVAWIESEIAQWLNGRIQEQRW